MLTLISVALWSMVANAGQVGGKRTILTAGETVHAIHFRLGQSTILYFGFKPDTVICGNKNYFNIEKLREGVTIQPLANFPTNLSILDKERRYLFYLTPAKGTAVDSFVDVIWVPENEMLPIERQRSSKVTRVQEIGRIIKIGRELDLVLLRQKSINGSSRRIFEFELRNRARTTLKTINIAAIAMVGRKALASQTFVWEKNEVASGMKMNGRLILPKLSHASFDLVVRFQGKDIVTQISGVLH